MRYDIPDTSISEIAEGIILDYLGDKAKDVKCIDIEGLLVDRFQNLNGRLGKLGFVKMI